MGDVARLAGVSTQTVSRVSNGETYVSDALRERVLEAMKELGYRPNSAARAMKSGSFRTIGVVYQSLHPVGNHRSLEAVSEAAARTGYGTTIIPLDASTTKVDREGFTRMAETNVDAIIGIVPSFFEQDLERHFPTGMPTLILGPSSNPRQATVDFDQLSGTRQAVTHLLDLGHLTVHHIGGPEASFSARAREETWRQTLLQNGREVPPVITGDWTPNSGYLATQKVLAETVPTAIFVANDQMALGAYRAILEAGLRIPQDISIVGFDNIDETVAYPPPLTTVSQDWEAIGQTAVDLTVAMLNGKPPQHKLHSTRLIVRDSTASPQTHGERCPARLS